MEKKKRKYIVVIFSRENEKIGKREIKLNSY